MNRRSEPTPVNLLTALRSHQWFADCAEDMQDALIAHSRLHHLEAEESLFERGEECIGLCCVIAGAVRLGSVSPHDGRHRLTMYLEPYQWFGEIALADDKLLCQSAVADTASTVLVVPRLALGAWLDKHPAAWRDIARLASLRLRLVFMVVEDNASLSVEQQLARRLLVAATGYGQSSVGSVRRRLRLPQEYIARMLGVSRQTVNKALKVLASEGILAVHYAEIEILDMRALIQRAGPFEDDIWQGMNAERFITPS